MHWPAGGGDVMHSPQISSEVSSNTPKLADLLSGMPHVEQAKSINGSSVWQASHKQVEFWLLSPHKMQG